MFSCPLVDGSPHSINFADRRANSFIKQKPIVDKRFAAFAGACIFSIRHN